MNKALENNSDIRPWVRIGEVLGPDEQEEIREEPIVPEEPRRAEAGPQ